MARALDVRQLSTVGFDDREEEHILVFGKWMSDRVVFLLGVGGSNEWALVLALTFKHTLYFFVNLLRCRTVLSGFRVDELSQTQVRTLWLKFRQVLKFEVLSMHPIFQALPTNLQVNFRVLPCCFRLTSLKIRFNSPWKNVSSGSWIAILHTFCWWTT